MNVYKNSNPYLSIVVPLFNEEDNVEILYKELHETAVMIARPCEMIFVDDGSTDKTLEKLTAIKNFEDTKGQFSICIKLVKFSINFGQTPAMQAGFDIAKGEIIVSLDGDLQNDPKDIPKLVNKLEEGYDLVCGWRKNRQDKTATRIIPSKIANWMIRRLVGVTIHDLGCSLKAYHSSVIKSVSLYSDLHRFIPAITSIQGAKISEVVVNHRPRKYGKAKYGLSRTWKVLLDLITLKMLVYFQDRPIIWFAFFGVLFGISGIILGTASVVVYIQGIESLVFPAASFLSFFLSGSFFSWGILAEYFISQEKG